MKNPIRSIRPFIGSKDFATSRQFYTDFGFDETVLAPNFLVFQSGGFAFYLQDAYVKDWIDNSMLFLEVADTEAYHRQITSVGLPGKYPGVKVSDIREEYWGKEFFVHDPSGILWHIGEFYNR